MSTLPQDPFQLEADRERRPFTKADVKRGSTELINCRADAFTVRCIDVIVASGKEPAYETRSDFIQNALYRAVEEFYDQHPEGSETHLRYEFQLAEMERKSEYRRSFISRSESRLVILREDGDTNGLSEYLSILSRARGDFLDDAPKSHIAKIDDMLSSAKRLLSECQRAD